MAFLGALGSLFSPLLGSIGGVVKSTLGNIAPQLLGSLATSAVQGLAEKAGIDAGPRQNAGDLTRQAVMNVGSQFRRVGKDFACDDELRKIRKLEAQIEEMKDEEEEEERPARRLAIKDKSRQVLANEIPKSINQIPR